jgi:hypothetical protein
MVSASTGIRDNHLVFLQYQAYQERHAQACIGLAISLPVFSLKRAIQRQDVAATPDSCRSY